MPRLLHVLSRDEWKGLEGTESHRPPSLRDLGFVHLCTEEQLAGVLERWFPGRRRLVALELDPRRLTAPLTWETLPHGRFPHLLGPLNLSAVVDVRELD